MQMQAEGRKLVLTNGCFDLLHAGHVRYLREARALGDALAVALNSDESVARLKGPDRPLNPAEDRAEVLAALADVDYVTVFGENDASGVVAEVHPAVYVKGGDYQADPNSPRFPPEGRVVSSYGGEVRILPYLSGRSTTSLIERKAQSER
jgi:D-beta-D-heptose 7-phosphate kinase/D-beta-D-heptose 1-phosphate adenosyltransferase